MESKDYAKEVEGLGLADVLSLVKEALDDKYMYSFGELLARKEVQEMQGSEHDVVFNTLELFAYGTLKGYYDSQDKYFELNDSQLTRLKLLTLVTLGCKNKMLTYDTLHSELNTESARELEDLVIEAVYHGLLTAKIDQKNEILRISSCSSRDITTSDINTMTENIVAWREKVVRLMTSMEESSSLLNSQRQLLAEESDIVHKIVGDELKDMLAPDRQSHSPNQHSSSSTFAMASSIIHGHGRNRPKRSRGFNSVR